MSFAQATQPPIEDYALIGDCRTAALVARNGSIDWLCWPRFDSNACLAALLGGPENGRFQIAPTVGITATARRYREMTMILETDFSTETGEVRLIDFMVPGKPQGMLVRRVEGRSGRVPMRMELALRFDYGQSVPWVTKRRGGNGIVAISGPDMVVLRTDAELRGKDFTTISEFDVAEGQIVTFVLTHSPSHEEVPPAHDPADALYQTEQYWCRWASRFNYDGEWAGSIRRSLLVLKALTYDVTGGIVAAPTTSLPEKFGGERNWDYRFCWLRDASLTLFAFMVAGYYDESGAWAEWLQRSIAGNPDQTQIMYGIAGERRLDEWTMSGLSGYQGARPVRIGNAASNQVQLDVFGELFIALSHAREGELLANGQTWSLQRALLKHLAKIWCEPDNGLWETRGGPKHFTFSKVMAWCAFDRAIKDAEKYGYEGPLDEWRQVRDEIRETVLRDGFNSQMNSFVQYFVGTAHDASLLRLPIVGFLPADDPRVAGTLAKVEERLVEGIFVRRYRTEAREDGLPGDEGAFLACSFWYVEALHLSGRDDEARAVFDQLLKLVNDVGLLSEEYDNGERRFCGNFPQAFSHLSLVTTAMTLGGVRRC